MLHTTEAIEQRFWRSVAKTDSCWIWRGNVRTTGYGRIYLGDGVHEYVHRYAYRLLTGPIPDGLTLDHTCCNRRCVNPAHLEPVSAVDNVKRGGLRRRRRNGHGDALMVHMASYWLPMPVADAMQAQAAARGVTLSALVRDWLIEASGVKVERKEAKS